MLAEEVSWAGNELSQAQSDIAPKSVARCPVVFPLSSLPSPPHTVQCTVIALLSSAARAPRLPCIKAGKGLQNRTVSSSE